jgi:hypothetical protein
MPEEIGRGLNVRTIEKCEEALDLMRSALRMLDDAGSSLDAGAHLDLAICRLEQSLEEARANQ